MMGTVNVVANSELASDCFFLKRLPLIIEKINL